MMTNGRLKGSRWVVCAQFMVVVFLLLVGVCSAQVAANVQQGMKLLKAKSAELGTPSLKGEDVVAGKTVPGLYFGTTMVNNNFTVVDEVKEAMGGTATYFVKSGSEFVRVSTNVKKADGTRAIGTILDPHGKVIQAIRKGKAYYGEADILGKMYVTGYEPIRDGAGKVIGIYYVGYEKQ
jgi:hypothetical protein